MLETYEVTENGDIKISDRVISVIATVAALSVDGVSKMSGSFTEDLQSALKLRTDEGKGVEVNFKENSLNVGLYIFVEYGYPLIEVAGEVQKAVSESIKSMTDMQIGSIDVTIDGVNLDSRLKSVPSVNK